MFSSATNGNNKDRWVIIDPRCEHCMKQLDAMIHSKERVPDTIKVRVIKGEDDSLAGLSATEFPHTFECNRGGVPGLGDWVRSPNWVQPWV